MNRLGCAAEESKNTDGKEAYLATYGRYVRAFIDHRSLSDERATNPAVLERLFADATKLLDVSLNCNGRSCPVSARDVKVSAFEAIFGPVSPDSVYSALSLFYARNPFRCDARYVPDLPLEVQAQIVETATRFDRVASAPLSLTCRAWHALYASECKKQDDSYCEILAQLFYGIYSHIQVKARNRKNFSFDLERHDGVSKDVPLTRLLRLPRDKAVPLLHAHLRVAPDANFVMLGTCLYRNGCPALGHISYHLTPHIVNLRRTYGWLEGEDSFNCPPRQLHNGLLVWSYAQQMCCIKFNGLNSWCRSIARSSDLLSDARRAISDLAK